MINKQFSTHRHFSSHFFGEHFKRNKLWTTLSISNQLCQSDSFQRQLFGSEKGTKASVWGGCSKELAGQVQRGVLQIWLSGSFSSIFSPFLNKMT